MLTHRGAAAVLLAPFAVLALEWSTPAWTRDAFVTRLHLPRGHMVDRR